MIKVQSVIVAVRTASFSGSEAAMVYTLLSRPMVYTPFPCFPQDVVYTIAFRWLCDGDRAREEGCHGGGVYSLFPVRFFGFCEPFLAPDENQNFRNRGTTPISGKNALGVKRPFSELWGSSGGILVAALGVQKNNSQTEQSHSRMT